MSYPWEGIEDDKERTAAILAAFEGNGASSTRSSHSDT
jgi:hypothetical protein